MLTPVQFKRNYSLYKELINIKSSEISQKLGNKVTIIPTSKKICKRNGLEQEIANSLNTANFLEKVYSMLKNKGYKIPGIYIDESLLPRKQNLAGMQTGNWNVFGPGRLDVSEPSLVIHEAGHFLHNKNMWYNQNLYSVFSSLRGLFRPILNKKEKEILTKDFKRAYEEGFFRNLQLDKCLKKGYVTPQILEKFNKAPEKLLVKNAFYNVDEFIAEYFTLASQGFKFSPEITKRYKAFHGPEIKEIITKKEIDDLMEYKNSIENSSIVL